jgi:hypothetical protein
MFEMTGLKFANFSLNNRKKSVLKKNNSGVTEPKK